MGSFGRKVTVMNRIRCTAAAEDTQKRKREKKGPQSTYWCQRIDAFKLWFWRTLLGVHWTVRKSNQSILKKINPEYSLEGLMLKLKLQHFGHLMWRADSLEKTLMLGKIEGRRKREDRGWDGRMTSPTQWTWVWVNSRRWWWTGKPGVLQSMGSQKVRHDWVNSTESVLLLGWACLSGNLEVGK